MVPPKYLSVTGAHDWAALIDLKTPPPVVPIQNSFSRDGLPVTATERPPRNGPTSRQRRPVRASESCAASAAGIARVRRGGMNRRTFAGPDVGSLKDDAVFAVGLLVRRIGRSSVAA